MLGGRRDQRRRRPQNLVTGRRREDADTEAWRPWRAFPGPERPTDHAIGLVHHRHRRGGRVGIVLAKFTDPDGCVQTRRKCGRTAQLYGAIIAEVYVDMRAVSDIFSHRRRKDLKDSPKLVAFEPDYVLRIDRADCCDKP